MRWKSQNSWAVVYFSCVYLIIDGKDNFVFTELGTKLIAKLIKNWNPGLVY